MACACLVHGIDVQLLLVDQKADGVDTPTLSREVQRQPNLDASKEYTHRPHPSFTKVVATRDWYMHSSGQPCLVVSALSETILSLQSRARFCTGQ